MNQLWWWMVEPVSRLLEADEREAVLGDLGNRTRPDPARCWMYWMW
jgi:hypothetical protein